MSLMESADIVAIASELLSKRFGGVQKLSDIQQLSGSGAARVLRARVASTPFMQQRSVILKYVPVTGEKIDDAALVREIVAYQFTTSLSEEVRPGPVLLAYDVDKRMMVLSDSGDGDTFSDLLESPDPERRIQILRNLGTALGKMHSGTAQREQDFHILLTRMLRHHPDVREVQELRDLALTRSSRIGQNLIRSAGIEIPPVVEAFAHDSRKQLLGAHHRAFTPFDLSPDNIIVAEKTHFLDYEWAGFRDVSFDLACVIAGFPQFLFTHPINDEEVDVFLEAWVSEVHSLWPQMNNERELHATIVGAMVSWAFSGLALMHFGSMVEAAVKLNEDGEEVNLDSYSHILRTAEEGPFSHEEILVRRDLHETFEALSRYAARSNDSEFLVTAMFAQQVAQRVKEPGPKAR